jgi:hypothetical protein
MNCPNHPNIPAIRVCQECGAHFCNTCVPLKQGKTICKDCRKDLIYIKERDKQKAGEERAEEDLSPKGKDVQQNRIGNLIKTAQEKQAYMASVKICVNHKDLQAVASCGRCKKNLCEKCIAFEHKDDLICQECWKKIPLSQRLSRQSKGHW